MSGSPRVEEDTWPRIVVTRAHLLPSAVEEENNFSQ